LSNPLLIPKGGRGFDRCKNLDLETHRADL